MEPMPAPIDAKRGMNLFSLWVVLPNGSHAANLVNSRIKYFVSLGVMSAATDSYYFASVEAEGQWEACLQHLCFPHSQ